MQHNKERLSKDSVMRKAYLDKGKFQMSGNIFHM